jgi:mRNA interferase MazF
VTTTSGLSFGDVVLVPFPFTDQSGVKKRPAVVVSSSDYNASRRDSVIMAITSQVRQPLAFAEAMVVDWRGCGLIRASVFKPVFESVELGLVIRTLGSLPAADAKTLRAVVGEVIG